MPPTGASTTSTGSGTAQPSSYTQPHVGYAPAPQPVVVQQSSGFGSSFAGALGGTLLGNALFSNHHSGTTVVNNGGYTQPQPVAQSSNGVAGGTVDSNGYTVTAQPVIKQQEQYGMWHFMWDLISFVVLVALVVGIAWVFYKGYKMVKTYVDKERGVSTIPFQPTQRFWEIQKAFVLADVNTLQNLLGPDIVDELTNNLQPTAMSIHNVSHEVRLSNNTEFSIWYKFEDDGAEVNQVWHYEKFDGVWKLNGIENV